MHLDGNRCVSVPEWPNRAQQRSLVAAQHDNTGLDRDPPPTPSFLIAGSSYSNRTLYDLIGRQFMLGLRYRMD